MVKETYINIKCGLCYTGMITLHAGKMKTCPLTDNMVGLYECTSYCGKQEVVITKQGHAGERERERKRKREVGEF